MKKGRGEGKRDGGRKYKGSKEEKKVKGKKTWRRERVAKRK